MDNNELRIEINWGKIFGGTTYTNTGWGVNIWTWSKSVGWHRWAGWPCTTLKEARQLARDQARHLPGAELSLAAKRG